MRQGDGADLLGPNDPRSATIGVVYVAPQDDRQTVLTAILTQDKLGRKQVVVVLPEQNKAFQRPVDFDGLKNIRRGLKSEIVFVTPNGPGPAEFARQRRFPVYSSIESFTHSLKTATPGNGSSNGSAKKRIFGFGRKQDAAAAVAVASVARSGVEEVPGSPNHTNGSVNTPQHESISEASVDPNVVDEKNGSIGRKAAVAGMAGLGVGAGVTALVDEHQASSTLERSEVDWNGQSPGGTVAHANGDSLSSSMPVQDGEEPERTGTVDEQNGVDAGPGIITFSANATRPKTFPPIAV